MASYVCVCGVRPCMCVPACAPYLLCYVVHALKSSSGRELLLWLLIVPGFTCRPTHLQVMLLCTAYTFETKDFTCNHIISYNSRWIHLILCWEKGYCVPSVWPCPATQSLQGPHYHFLQASNEIMGKFSVLRFQWGGPSVVSSDLICNLNKLNFIVLIVGLFFWLDQI